jgi:hypothetical protein
MFHSASMWRFTNFNLAIGRGGRCIIVLPSFRRFSILGSYQRWVYFTTIQSHMKSLILRGKNDPSLSRTKGNWPTGSILLDTAIRQGIVQSRSEPPPLSSRTASGEVFNDGT